MDICPVCDGEVLVVADGVYPIHYRSSLFRCEGSGQPVAEDAPEAAVEPAVEPEKPVKKAAPRKKAPPKA